MNTKSIDELIDDPETKIEDLLENENIVQEVKYSTQKVIN